MDINKGNKKRKIRETSREGERNRKFVSDSSLDAISFNQCREMRRSSRWPWNPGTMASAVFGGLSHTCQLVCPAGREGCYLVTHPRCAQVQDFGLEG